MSDRDQIIETITRLFWLTDHHQWDRLAPLFTREVRLDYTSLQGGQPSTLAPEAIVAGWQDTLGALDAHQHLVCNHLVTASKDHAEATAAFQAIHQYAGQTWTLGGDYAFDLVHVGPGWKITTMTMTAVWQTGDPQLLGRAGQSAQA